ncbi:MAG: GNAT family N-acetyltransferase [Alicyclobacillus sp.]|nr:GNAT family N-acetyltransferase [Alicyclobacillus sp.]
MTADFRISTPDDAELIRYITQDAWAEYKNVPGSSSALDETVEQIRTTLTDGHQMAAVGIHEEKAVAAIRFRLMHRRLGVRPAYQGHGHAKMALLWLEDFARKHNVNEIRCAVRVSVPRNVRLYESVGYRKVDEQIIVKSPDIQLVVWTMAKAVS